MTSNTSNFDMIGFWAALRCAEFILRQRAERGTSKALVFVIFGERIYGSNFNRRSPVINKTEGKRNDNIRTQDCNHNKRLIRIAPSTISICY